MQHSHLSHRQRKYLTQLADNLVPTPTIYYAYDSTTAHAYDQYSSPGDSSDSLSFVGNTNTETELP
jgi:hypothetical protein